MQNYSKTYVGMIVILFGWFGISNLVAGDEVALIVDNVLQLVGIGIAIYGRYKAGGVNILGFRK